MMRKIIRVHFPGIDGNLIENSVNTFYKLRQIDNIEKKPATRELLNWIRAIKADPDFNPKQLAKGEIPYLGVLYKKSQDYERVAHITNYRKLY